MIGSRWCRNNNAIIAKIGYTVREYIGVEKMQAEDVGSEYIQVANEFKKFSQELRDPLVVGALLNKLTEENTSFNLVLKEINRRLEKLDSLEQRLAQIEQKIYSPKPPQVPNPLLPEVDEDMISFIAQKGKATATDVQQHFKYKGSNAASARLNNLCRMGLLHKQQVGRKVFFVPKSQ